ncbi:growth-regulating factor 5 [Salvia miltiorrhiza]|uniref:growth-regulating factor 5 n=1 Tax=Salvia miltiorrhiza TaxID=226208 RepID=UPI0025AC0A4D|nr:growth-regulating factor 5 [Salvia miltiorrhiza]
MMSGSVRSSRFPFTASQWQELEHQALVFKYMVSGMPIPPDLLFTIRTSLDSSLSSKFLIHQPQHIGWNSFHMGFGRKIDPEPGRCRRTDGKKWRCSKEAYPDSKYCERHMHRGRNRSRKPVEILSPTTAATPRNAHPPSSSSTPISSEPHFLYPHFPSSRPAAADSTNFFLDSRPPLKDFRHGNGIKGENEFFSSDSNPYSSSKLEPLKMELKHNNAAYLSDQSYRQYQHDRYYSAAERAEEQPKKVMHHFLEEWAPKDAEPWSNADDKMPTHRTQLSISVPNSLHDFFVTQK